MAEISRLTKTSRRLAIVGWFLAALVYLAYYLVVLRLDFAQMLVPCDGSNCHFLAISTAEMAALASWGQSTHAYALFMSSLSVISVIIYWALGGMIVLRHGGSRLGLTVSLALIIIPISTFAGSTDWSATYPSLLIPGIVLGILGTAIMLVFFYLLPNGRFSPGWSYISLVLTIVLVSILTLVINDFISLSAEIISYLGAIIVGLVILGGSFHIYRYWRDSNPLERQQTKWILLGVLAYMLSVVLWALIFGKALAIPPGRPRILAMLVGWSFIIFFMLVLPVAITIAISRYRLWDIDLIIRRTLQYGILTGLLAVVYFGSVVLLQSLVENITGEQSPVVIVISTLVIAALFNPLRIRIQDFIDRRFFRKKYDAEQTLARFAEVARDEVDMDKLTAALLGVVEESMQPEKVSVWFRGPEVSS